MLDKPGNLTSTGGQSDMPTRFTAYRGTLDRWFIFDNWLQTAVAGPFKIASVPSALRRLRST